MTDQAVTVAPQPTTPRERRNPPLKVAGRLKAALDAMVWECMTDNAAACKVGITVAAIRLALQRGHVRAYYRAQLQVLRERESSRNVHRLCEIRDAANNMPAVQAIKALEQLAEEPSRNTNAPPVPGLVVQVVVNSAAQPPAKPLIEHE
jgi:hypothetical protein